MSFDISKATNFDRYNKGSFLAFTDPDTGGPLLDENKKEIGVYLLSRLGTAGQQYARDVRQKRLDFARRGVEVTASVLEDEATDLLVAMTTGWTFDELDGQPFEYSPENARIFWTDPRFATLREKADAFIGNEANFTKR